MRAIEAKDFSGYGGLRQIELPKPLAAKDRVLIRVTAAGVTPLEYTVLSGGHLEPRRRWCSAMRARASLRTPATPGSQWEVA